jgi:hypothetical protein
MLNVVSTETGLIQATVMPLSHTKLIGDSSMGFIYEPRPSDSPIADMVMRGRSVSSGTLIRPAASNWHLVLSKYEGETKLLVVGPWTASGALRYVEGAEILWIRLRLGTFMSHLPMTHLLDSETPLPVASSKSFWLKGAAYQFPNFENADTFLGKLVSDGVLTHDPIVDSAMRGQQLDLSPRTIRQRLALATGLTQNHIKQVERAQRAAALLRHGISISDAAFELGYYDQPHLTHALKRWVGYTPAQIAGQNGPG